MRTHTRTLLQTLALTCAGLAGLGGSPFAVAQTATGAVDAAMKARPAVQQPTLKQNSPGTRSAQSNCVREANRRGFTVLDTTNFQQFRDGWSIDLRVRDMRGRVSRGSCFVETRSGDVNLYGFGWGYDDEGNDRATFNCASVDNRYRECQLPVNGRARLVKRVSESRCVEGKSWGQRNDRVWVDRGCRGRFEVTRSGGAGGDDNTIECSSTGARYRECQIGSGYFGRLDRELSNRRCREDVTYGTRNGVIWVTDGCRARFIRQRGNAGGSGGIGNRTIDCRSDAGRRNECSLGHGYVALLVQDLSNGRCRRDATWGTRNGVVWVSNGCSARFERLKEKGTGDRD